MFSLICAWINDLVNNREAGDLRCHRGHYDVNVMKKPISIEIVIFYELPCIDVYIYYLGIICCFNFIMWNLFTFPPQMNIWSQNGTNQYSRLLLIRITHSLQLLRYVSKFPLSNQYISIQNAKCNQSTLQAVSLYIVTYWGQVAHLYAYNRSTLNQIRVYREVIAWINAELSLVGTVCIKETNLKILSAKWRPQFFNEAVADNTIHLFGGDLHNCSMVLITNLWSAPKKSKYMRPRAKIATAWPFVYQSTHETLIKGRWTKHLIQNLANLCSRE